MTQNEPDLADWRRWSRADLDWYVALAPDARQSVARRMSTSLKLALGSMLFDRECEIIEERIHELLPDAPAALTDDLLQLALARLHE